MQYAIVESALATIDQLQRERDDLARQRSRLESDWNDLRNARGKIEQERDGLRAERNQFERDRAAAEKGHATNSATLTAELNAARDKISALTTSLLDRTEELRTLDNVAPKRSPNLSWSAREKKS